MCFKNKIKHQILGMVSVCSIVLAPAAHATLLSHFKQVSDDGHTNILYSLHCTSPQNEDCSLHALIITDDHGKNSCLLSYQMIFENQKLTSHTDHTYSFQLNRAKCNDTIYYILNKNLLITKVKENAQTTASLDDGRCEEIKALHNDAVKIEPGMPLSQIKVDSCESLLLRMDNF